MLNLIQRSEESHRSNLERIIGNVDKARAALEWCRDRGLSAYSVDVESANPKILVETCGQLAELVRDGLAAEIGAQACGGIHSRIMCAPVAGCNVLWVERGN